MPRFLVLAALTLCTCGRALGQSPSASPRVLPARAFVMHKELPAGEKGGRIPALLGRDPIYLAGEKVTFGAYRPGGDDFILESVQVKLSSSYTNSVGFTMPLTETNSSSNTYMGTVDVNDKLVTQAPTRDRGFAVLLADPSTAGAELGRMALQGYPGMPREDLGQVNVREPGDVLPPVRVWLEQGGAEPVTITYGPLTARFLVARCANWIYASGRYDPASGFIALGGLGPQDMPSPHWRDSLQVLVLAASHAADVNDEASREPTGPLRGQHGIEWWKKFGRTVLGYSGEAPGGAAEGAIARRFLKLAARGPGPANEVRQSEHFVRAWLIANQQQLVTGACGLDAAGRYVRQPPGREVTLRGVPFTLPSVPPWIATPRTLWEPRSAEIREESLHEYWADYLLAELAKQRSGAPPAEAEFLTEDGISWILTAAKEPVKDVGFRARVRAVMSRRHRHAASYYRVSAGRRSGQGGP